MSDPAKKERVSKWERVWKALLRNDNYQGDKDKLRNLYEKRKENLEQTSDDKKKPNQKENVGESAGEMKKENTSATDNKKSGNLPPQRLDPIKVQTAKPAVESAKVETSKPVSKPVETPKSGGEKSDSKNNASSNSTTLAKDIQTKGNDGNVKEATKLDKDKKDKNAESKKDGNSDNKRKTNEDSAAGDKEKTKVNSAGGKEKKATDSDKTETAKQPDKKQKEGEGK